MTAMTVDYHQFFWPLSPEKKDKTASKNRVETPPDSDRDVGIQLGAAKQSLVLERMEN